MVITYEYLKDLTPVKSVLVSALIDNPIFNCFASWNSSLFQSQSFKEATAAVIGHLEEDSSVAILAKEAGEVVGSVVLTPRCKEYSSKNAYWTFHRCLDNEFVAVHDLADTLHHGIDLYSAFCEDQFLNLGFLYVVPKHRNKGIAKKLITEAISYSEKIGVNSISATVMSFYAQRVLEKFGFTTLNSVIHDKFRFRTKSAFDSTLLGVNASSLLMCYNGNSDDGGQ